MGKGRERRGEESLELWSGGRERTVAQTVTRGPGAP